jgi:hypothetical protein
MTSPGVAVTADEISAYLQSKGWQLDGEWRGSRVWRLEGRTRLLVPMHADYDDAAELIEQAIAKIAKYEERPERDLRLDITEPMADTQYFRMHPQTPAGLIPLPTGLKAVQSIQNLMKSAAAVVEVGPQLIYERYRSAQIESFLRRVMLGSAVPGSYILTARLPAQPAGRSQGTSLTGRSVSSRLHAALLAAQQAAQQALEYSSPQGSLQAFYGAVDSGVSANLCRALADLGGEDKNRPFDIGFGWARDMPADASELAEPRVAFTAAMPAILEQAGEELAALGRSGTARITGRVKDLQEQPGGRHRVQVQGQLAMETENRIRRRAIWVVVNSEQHEIAIAAYRNQQIVEVNGRLSTERGNLELLAATLSIVP